MYKIMLSDYECVDGAVECSTLTSEQAVGVMHYAGVKISIPIFQDGVEQGVFPFAFVIEGGKRNFIISRKKLEEWLLEFAGVTVSCDRILKEVKLLES